MRRGARRAIVHDTFCDMFGSRSRAPSSSMRRRQSVSSRRTNDYDSETEYNMNLIREKFPGLGGSGGGGGRWGTFEETLGGPVHLGGGVWGGRSGPRGHQPGDDELLRRYEAGDESAECCAARTRDDVDVRI